MRFKRFCSLGVAAAIGMSILAGTAAAKETTAGLTFDFNQNDGGFTPIFSDYPNEQGVEEFYELRSGHEEVPIAEAGKGLFLSGNNHSDDLFMGYYKDLSGLVPETEYHFTVRFQLATNVENDMIGIGGAPGESVFVKCGVASKEPENSLDSLNHFCLNIDKGSQSTSGSDMIVVGNLAKEEINRPGEYEFNEIETKVIARTDEAGTAYLVIGTDSGFEGVTSYYLDDISVSWADTATVSITRGDAVKMLFDHAHRWDEAVGPPTFTDVAWDAPYAEAVAWAEQNGYLGDYGNGFFGPEDMMSVEQAMVMIYRLFGSPKVTDAGVLDSYKDASQISPWARDAVAFSITNKLLVPDGKILPQSPISVKALRYAIGQIGMAD
ncbi:S-layer homology domain-containing protein [Pseudoflavonifractor hominis]|uniref:S-layer homology domain-containing protein n=1 Tax=Pseudoflavonifractor hominis TaxID=2763059 RepID=A0ABR7HTI1_9FIRM|nr:S-layer homology domain-containing protein [Pseudoflavonifractor hominis]MBC5730824.1 S-layer homology domain-containing protein [Pseudoflavonifractor hominis]